MGSLLVVRYAFFQHYSIKKIFLKYLFNSTSIIALCSYGSTHSKKIQQVSCSMKCEQEKALDKPGKCRM